MNTRQPPLYQPQSACQRTEWLAPTLLAANGRITLITLSGKSGVPLLVFITALLGAIFSIALYDESL